MSDQTDLLFDTTAHSKANAVQDKKRALHFYPCKSKKDSRDLNKEQGKGKSVCNKAVLNPSAGEVGFFHV